MAQRRKGFCARLSNCCCCCRRDDFEDDEFDEDQVPTLAGTEDVNVELVNNQNHLGGRNVNNNHHKDDNFVINNNDRKQNHVNHNQPNHHNAVFDARGQDEVQENGEKEEELKASIEDAQVSESYRFWERNKTFKEAKVLSTSKQQNLHKTMKATMKATLGGGELRDTVKLPEGEDLHEWIAVNTVHFYNAANMIYGTCADFCTAETCKTMSAGRNEYLWKDGIKYKKPTRVPAPVYVDELLNWVNNQISDPELFPIDEHARFPPKFMSKIRNIYKRMFRLYAHIYWSHFEKIRSIGANAHLNTCFKHFVYFILEFDLVDKKGLSPLESFITKFREADDDYHR